MEANDDDIDFSARLKTMLGLDSDAVEDLLDRLDADQLQELTDAVAINDKDAASEIVNGGEADEEVNPLFRGANLDAVKNKKQQRRRNRDGNMQFAIGDKVMINVRDKHGKMHSVSATVDKPEGPEGSDTIVVKVEGTSHVVDKTDVDKLDEGVLGMIGLPNLHRIQQLAGIDAQGSMQQSEAPPAAPAVAAQTDNPLGQALAALDALETALPNIILGDLKVVRQRLCAIQQALNENFPRSMPDRARKL